MTEVNGMPVNEIAMTVDFTGTRGTFSYPTVLGKPVVGHPTYRPGDRIVVTGHGMPIVGTVQSVRWDPTRTDVEWSTPSYMQRSAADIIDEAARELAARHPA